MPEVAGTTEEVCNAKQKKREQMHKMNRKLKYAQKKQMNILNDDKNPALLVL